MVKVNVYGLYGDIVDSADLSTQEPYNDPTCTHPADKVRAVDDNSGIDGVTAYQCECGIGWLVKDKINEEKQK